MTLIQMRMYTRQAALINLIFHTGFSRACRGDSYCTSRQPMTTVQLATSGVAFGDKPN